jgi:hypothetical protein
MTIYPASSYKIMSPMRIHVPMQIWSSKFKMQGKEHLCRWVLIVCSPMFMYVTKIVKYIDTRCIPIAIHCICVSAIDIYMYITLLYHQL